MVKVLIPTKHDDTHAQYVKLALAHKGHQGHIWYPGDFPSKQTYSFELLKQKAQWYSQGTEINFNASFDVVWHRRPERPKLYDLVHPEDQENAKKECGMFYQSFWELISPNAMWINPVNKIRAANSKLLQLKIASEIGLNIPPTIISNDPERIKSFIDQSEKKVVCKTLSPMHWINKNEFRLAYTREISKEDLPSYDILKMTPAIFQEKIQKLYELRITYFGNYPVAVKIHSQAHPKGEMDWRYMPSKTMMLEQYHLPDSVDQLCKLLMKKLGIVFGCFDFIVTPDYEYYFLEVNESGQFLWIEEINPEIKMLEIFTEFLINKNPLFKWEKTGGFISMHDFAETVEPINI